MNHTYPIQHCPYSIFSGGPNETNAEDESFSWLDLHPRGAVALIELISLIGLCTEMLQMT